MFEVGHTVIITDGLNIVNDCYGTVIGVYDEGGIIQVGTESPKGTWLLKPEQLHNLDRKV
jgi:hypothetical protein|tara:strand:- start:1178 stop:1357 length:180 start_codon:yes stop_codon:yes gene_type:complete